MSYIASLREELRLPFNLIQKSLKTFHNLELSSGALVEICHQIATMGKPLYNNLATQVKQEPVLHADETGWREGGVNGYVWGFNTPDYKYLTYRQTRGKIVVQEVVGQEFEGVLISDFYASYNTHLGFHQRCWVHLLRDIKKLTEEHNQDVVNWASQVKDIYHQAKSYSGPDPNKFIGARAQELQRWKDQEEFRDRLLQICRPFINKKVPQQTLCQRIDKYQDELFMFIVDPRVSPDNNSAERALRHTVISRKISGGTRTKKGSKTKFTLASLFGTWRLQAKNPFHECIKMLVASSTNQPLPAITV